MKTSSTIIQQVMVFFLLPMTVAAQFSLSGEIRPRSEYRHGFTSVADTAQDPAFFIDQRSRLKFNYLSEKYEIGIVMQDIRTWGSTSQLNRTDGFTSIHEAWGKVLFNKNLSLKLGRQEVIYDDHRIFGSVAWAQQARSHDLAKFRYNDSTTTFDVGLAFNQDRPQLTTNVYTVARSYKAFQYLWFHKDVSKGLGISILALNNGLQYSETDTAGSTTYSVKYSQTAGTHITFKKNKFKAIGSFYYQMGKDVTDRDISAYDIKADLFYTLAKGLVIGAGYELLSGTSQIDTANKDNNSFNPFYGTNHKFNGYMDYFYVGNHANSVGLQDIYFSLAYKQKKFTEAVAVHLFSSAADILDVEKFTNDGTLAAMNPSLGTEIDFTIKYQYSKEVGFQLGYSHMLPTASMVALKGGNKDEINNWAYLMITIKPVFLKQ